ESVPETLRPIGDGGAYRATLAAMTMWRSFPKLLAMRLKPLGDLAGGLSLRALRIGSSHTAPGGTRHDVRFIPTNRHRWRGRSGPLSGILRISRGMIGMSALAC